MKAKITISCDDEEQLLTHLRIIIKEIKQNMKINQGELLPKTKIEDNNCYGYHLVNISYIL
jgi:hypothetical protein